MLPTRRKSKSEIGELSKEQNDVDSYFAALPEPARSTLEKAREAVRAAAPEAEETISYQIPTFKYRGRPLIYLAGFKDHCSVFPTSDSEWKSFKEELKAAGAKRTGKGTLQFPVDKPLPAALLKKMVKMRLKEIEGK